MAVNHMSVPLQSFISISIILFLLPKAWYSFYICFPFPILYSWNSFKSTFLMRSLFNLQPCLRNLTLALQIIFVHSFICSYWRNCLGKISSFMYILFKVNFDEIKGNILTIKNWGSVTFLLDVPLNIYFLIIIIII